MQRLTCTANGCRADKNYRRADKQCHADTQKINSIIVQVCENRRVIMRLPVSFCCLYYIWITPTAYFITATAAFLQKQLHSECATYNKESDLFWGACLSHSLEFT